MTVSNELYMALLAMDSYNRGYKPLVDLVAAGSSSSLIGNVAINSSSNAAAGSPEYNAGFFAQSYTLGNQKIISYRGTDQLFTPPWSDDPGGDPWNGYGTALGLPFNDQARMAAEFFQDVTGTASSDPSAGNAVLVGHSLGGGLAGFIGAIYRQNAYLYNNMPFELSVSTLREAALINSTIKNDFYNGGAINSALISSNLHAYATTGELLTNTRLFQTTPVTEISPHTNGLSLVQLHSMALHTILQYASEPLSAVGTNWYAIGKELWDAGFNLTVANAAGSSQLKGEYTG
jgi:hypothetical protein